MKFFSFCLQNCSSSPVLGLSDTRCGCAASSVSICWKGKTYSGSLLKTSREGGGGGELLYGVGWGLHTCPMSESDGHSGSQFVSDRQLEKNLGIFLSLTKLDLEIKLFNNLCVLLRSTKNKYYKLRLSFSPSVDRTRPHSRNAHLTQTTLLFSETWLPLRTSPVIEMFWRKEKFGHPYMTTLHDWARQRAPKTVR